MKYIILLLVLFFTSCTQETQNKIGKAIQNYTGTNGILEIYAGEVKIKQFIRIDKISTASNANDNNQRSYRYGYGYLDLNQNYKVDPNEKKIYFEISDYSTYIFYENPNL